LNGHDKVALFLLADLHINSTVAVCAPVINLDDGGTYHASRYQHWLYDCMMRALQQFRIDSVGYHRTALFNGDLGELDTKRRTYQIITPNKATILNFIQATIEPVSEGVDDLIFLRGTPAHVGKAAWLEEKIAKDLKAIPSREASSWYHYRGIAAGVKVDVAHHASMGYLPWTAKNAANKSAALALWHYVIEMKDSTPDILFRSHNHKCADSFDNYATRAVFTPALTMATEFGYRIGRENDIADIGAFALLCEAGKYELKKYLFHPQEARRVWQKAHRL
jgi:hypothetical protein